MRSYLLSDNHETFVAMRLAGIDGVIVHQREEILDALDRATRNKEIGIIIITEGILELIEPEITALKLSMRYPLIVEIPDRHGQRREEKYITKHINESVGIKI